MTSRYWAELTRRRLSRRRVLGGAVAFGAGAATVALTGACSESTATVATGDGRPVHGGRYVYANVADWGAIDPITSVAFGTAIFPRIYNTLVDRSRNDPDFFYMDLAETLEQPDDETYIYQIRPGVKIAPNDLGIEERDLDAFDAERWLERIRDDDLAVNKLIVSQWVASFEATDASTFTLKTNGPYAYLLFRLGGHLGGTLPPREFFEQGISLTNKGVGAGPFVIRPGSYAETGGIQLDRNVNYYRRDDATGEQLPYIDGIDIVRFSDRAPRRAAFISRQIFEYDPERAEEVADLQSKFPDLTVVAEPGSTFISFVMNPNQEPWNDDRIRKAAMFALNRQEFVDLIVGEEAGQPNGLVHWPLQGFALDPDELDQLQPYDPARSRELIRAATGEDSVTIKLLYPANMDAQFHQLHLPIFLKQMREAGFNVDEDPQDLSIWLADFTQVDYNCSLSLNQFYETAEIPLDFQSSQGPLADKLYAIGVGALHPEVDEAILASKRTVDPEQHKEKVKQAQRLIYEKGPTFLPIFTWVDFNVYHGFVRNFPNTRGLGTTSLFLNDWWLTL